MITEHTILKGEHSVAQIIMHSARRCVNIVWQAAAYDCCASNCALTPGCQAALKLFRAGNVLWPTVSEHS